MTLLKLELVPSSLAHRLIFFMVSRAICAAASFIVFFFFSIQVGLVLLLLWVLLSVGYFFYLHRVALAVFLLAARAAEQLPAGEPGGPARAAAPEHT